MIAVYFFQTHCIDYKYWQGEGSRQGAVPPPQKFFFNKTSSVNSLSTTWIRH